MAVEKRSEVFKCSVCGNTVEVVDVGGGILVCCEKEMILLKAKGKAEEGKEKHVPIVECEGCNVIVKVGSVPHPMESSHYISNIQLLKDGVVIAEKSLKHNAEPVAEFCLGDCKCGEDGACESDASCDCEAKVKDLTARIYCNLHDLWETKV